MITELLTEYGIHLSAHAIWDIFKAIIEKKKLSKDELGNELAQNLESSFHIENAKILSEKLIEFFVNEGAIISTGNFIYSDESIIQITDSGGIIRTKNSSMKTPNTQINVIGEGASITQKGNAKIVQSEKGIQITVGKSKLQ